jgi:hypothetical protein
VREYVPVVRYEYTVQGDKYLGERLHFGKQATDKTRAESVIGEYPAGQEVQVRYDPANPGSSSLQTNFRVNIFVPPVGVGMIIVGFLSIRFAWRLRQRNANEEHS